MFLYAFLVFIFMKNIIVSFALAIIILLTIFTFQLNLDYYHEKALSQNTKDNAYGVIDYVVGKNSDISFLSENERSHIEDVRDIIGIVKIVLYGLILFVFYYLLVSHNPIILKYTSYFIFVITSIFIISALFFTMSFELFHQILFPQGNYTFSSNSWLITLFPANYFQNFAIFWLVSYFFIGLILFFLSRLKFIYAAYNK